MQTDPVDPLDVLEDMSANVGHPNDLCCTLPNTASAGKPLSSLPFCLPLTPLFTNPTQKLAPGRGGYSSTGRSSEARRPGSSRRNSGLPLIPADRRGAREGKVSPWSFSRHGPPKHFKLRLRDKTQKSGLWGLPVPGQSWTMHCSGIPEREGCEDIAFRSLNLSHLAD